MGRYAALSAIDPARVTGYNFSLGADQDVNQGSVWIDDIQLDAGSSVSAPVEENEPEEEDTGQPEEAETESQPQRKLCGGAGAVLLLPLGAVVAIVHRRRRQ